MHILYLVSALDNPLYDGRYELYGRSMTFGQQSFIFDLIAGLARRGERVSLAIEDVDRFPLTEPMRRFCRIIGARGTPLPLDVDLVLLDEGSDRLLALCPPVVPAFRIVHNPATPFSEAVVCRCQRFVCLTERSMELMAARIPNEKLVLAHQGVDLSRFTPRFPRALADLSHIRVLIYSRLDANREPTIWKVLRRLECTSARVTLLGDGEQFWSICDRFGASITPIHFVPCTSIQNLLPNFDVVISSARGVMEALAMGLPALCGGYEYAGPVVRETIQDHLTVNITGFGMGVDMDCVWEDVRTAISFDPSACRSLAEDFCSVDRFIDRLLEELPFATATANATTPGW
ncbi:MAG TPA: hypothetical protein VFP05_16910 [Thermomicrobiales bacterium]|nr:hypothetical protein [Thermomicrobiales bacterium]